MTVRQFNVNSGLFSLIVYIDWSAFWLQTQSAKIQCLVSQGNMAQPNFSSLIMAHVELTVGVFANTLLPIIILDLFKVIFYFVPFPRHPVIFSADDWDVQSHPQQSIWVPLPFSEGDWIPRDCKSQIVHHHSGNTFFFFQPPKKQPMVPDIMTWLSWY